MAAKAVKAGSGKAPGGYNPWLVAVVVALATFMEILDTTIANVALRYISGGLAVGPDEAAWVVTVYLVANAVTLTASSFIARRYGRKLFFMTSIAVFTLASVLCGFAGNLETLLVFRVLQGLGGGGMAPLAQSILADSFPPEKRGPAFALYGIAIVFAPAIGPTLGGWLSDNFSWHWCFLINGPIGIFALAVMHVILHDPPSAVAERRRLKREGIRFDAVGFLLVATFLGSLEVCLDEGQRKDWFGSNLIVVFGALTAVSFVAMIPWLLTRKNPVVDLSLFKSRQFTACFFIMMATGAILYATTGNIPQLVQDQYGYTATLGGLVLGPAGLVTIVITVINGRLSGLIQPRFLIVFGALMMAGGLYDFTRLDNTSTFWFFADARILIGIGIPMMFMSVTTASYEGLDTSQTDQASAVINVARNTGGSMGVSLAANLLAYRGQFHQSRLVESIDTTAPAYQDALSKATRYFSEHGYAGPDAQNQAVAWIGSQVSVQVTYWAYIDVFWALCIVAMAAVPLALLLKNVKLGGAAAAH